VKHTPATIALALAALGLLVTQGLVGCAGSSGMGAPATGTGTGAGGTAGGSGGVQTSGTGGTTTTGAGGATGSGGTAGGTGAGGSSGAGGTTGSGAGGASAGGCPAGTTFCADFESGTLPAGAMFFPEYQRANVATFMTIDGAVAHGGTHALKVNGTDFSQMLGVPTAGPTFWVRAYLRADLDIQEGHNTYFLATTDATGDPNMNEAVRVGEHECQLELNRRSDDKELLSNGGTYQCMGGVVLKKETWYCLEAFYDGPNKEVRVFVDKTEVPQLHVTDWGPYTYKMFKFGFEKYHGPNRTLWFDDVAVGPQRIPCQ
jgi:hypothetical protein